MANIFLSPEDWEDEESNLPPIWWNDEDEEYQIFGDSPINADVYVYMFTSVVSPGDTLEFNYNFAEYTPPPGQQGYLNVVRNGTEVVHSVALNEASNGSVSVSFPSGADTVAIMLTISNESTSYVGFYLVDATLWVPPPPPEGYLVYELDKGWTFDGAFIPHFITLNWYFGEDPTVYKTMQKVRIHGLSKGIVQLQVQTNGIQTDYREDFSQPEHFDLKNPYEFVSEDFVPATNYADLANRGLAIQVKFQGRNNDVAAPEPSHVLQVMVPQLSPQGSGFSSN